MPSLWDTVSSLKTRLASVLAILFCFIQLIRRIGWIVKVTILHIIRGLKWNLGCLYLWQESLWIYSWASWLSQCILHCFKEWVTCVKPGMFYLINTFVMYCCTDSLSRILKWFLVDSNLLYSSRVSISSGIVFHFDSVWDLKSFQNRLVHRAPL